MSEIKIINGKTVKDETARNSITELQTQIDNIEVPTKTSDLTNDSDFVNSTFVTNKIAEASLNSGEVDLSGYVTKETGNANQITFADGQTFQAKLDAGILKGDKGDQGEQGESGASNINDTTASETTTYSSNKIENIKENLNSQITTINNNIQNIGNPTDEQVKNAINEAIANGDIIAGGLTSTAQTLLISILRSAVFTSDQSANITLLQSELAKGNSGGSSGGGSETTQYVITNTLNNATTSNNIALVNANSSYTATITVNEGYTLDAITVTMGGTDITSTAVSGTTITITSVTGNVVITVTTTESGSSSGGGMVTDGLVNYFDFRTATYNNTGAGGSTIISATQGNGSLFTWANNVVTAQDNYGMSISRAFTYNANSVGTTDTSCGNTFTWIFKSYMYGGGSPFFSTDYAIGNTNYAMQYKPKYNTSSGTAQGTAIYDTLGTVPALNTYNTWSIVVDGNICKLYKDSTLMDTRDGSTIDGFVSWYNKLICNVLVGKDKGKITQLAVYNKALNEVEMTDMIEYLSTLEVK